MILDDLRRRRAARRFQRWSEVEPEEDWARRAGVGTAVAVALFVAIAAFIVVGLVFAR
jgi:hypothetical protein